MSTREMALRRAHLCKPGGARTLCMFGGSIAFLATGEETAGAWSLLEYTVPPGFAGPAPHWHSYTTELFYVLEGTLTLRVGEAAAEVVPGGFGLVPPGVVHCFSNPADQPARFMVVLSPAGFERYFDALAELVQEEPAWPPADLSRVRALAEQYDTFAPPAAR